ncbi:unnamed protein product [Caenorhabditis bovis]|uniref:Protein kinase domain-containing protein n=2 Tax=Caenorhabditis bovis TaxID=2654633 RepID=A0A8S1EFX3_9PELO|nr:unnamed protein product [Caenorhabditis bovis]
MSAGNGKDDQIETHFLKETKVLLNNEAYRFRDDVKGVFGKVEAKAFVSKRLAEFRFEQTIGDRNRIKNEASMIVRLLRYGSTRAVRIYNRGEINGIKYIVTTAMGKNLADVLKEHKKLEPYAYLHILVQTFLSIRDIHDTHCAHFDIQPSSFSFKRGDPRWIQASSFHCAFYLRNYEALEKERLQKGERWGVSDDFESWIFMAYEIVHSEKLKWAKERNPLQMLYSKWLFLVTYRHSVKAVEKRMARLIELVFSCSQTNFKGIDELLHFELMVMHI